MYQWNCLIWHHILFSKVQNSNFLMFLTFLTLKSSILSSHALAECKTWVILSLVGLFRHWASVQILEGLVLHLKVKTFKLMPFVSRVLSWFCIVKCSATKFAVCFTDIMCVCMIFVWQVVSMQLAPFYTKEKRCNQLFEGIRKRLKGI